MKTTLDLPDDLTNEAMKVTQIKTKNKIIVTALEQLRCEIFFHSKFKHKLKIYKNETQRTLNLRVLCV